MGAMKGTEGLSLLVGQDEEGPFLIGGKCASCEAIFFPKQPICPRCTDRQIGETRLSRRGRLYTYTEVHQAPPDYEGPVPYLIGRVVLPEGVFVLAQLKARKEDLRINLEMELLVERADPEQTGGPPISYKFRPA